ncbi:MAG: hypothetical protein ACRC5C_13230 [Bacilli bacterium]
MDDMPWQSFFSDGFQLLNDERWDEVVETARGKEGEHHLCFPPSTYQGRTQTLDYVWCVEEDRLSCQKEGNFFEPIYFQSILIYQQLKSATLTEQLFSKCYSRLAENGLLCIETAGAGTLARLKSYLFQSVREASVGPIQIARPVYMPSLLELATLIEEAGFVVVYASLEDLPVEHDYPKETIDAYFRVFTGAFCANFIPQYQQTIAVRASALYHAKNKQHTPFVTDYVNLRIIAQKK